MMNISYDFEIVVFNINFFFVRFFRDCVWLFFLSVSNRGDLLGSIVIFD